MWSHYLIERLSKRSGCLAAATRGSDECPNKNEVDLSRLDESRLLLLKDEWEKKRETRIKINTEEKERKRSAGRRKIK